MRKPNLSEIERIVAAAEVEAAASIPTRPTPDRYPKLASSRHAAQGLAKDAFGRLGADTDKLEHLRAEHDAEMRRAAEDAKQAAIDGSAAASRRLDALVTSQRAALESIPLDSWSPGSELLLSVDFIRSWPSPNNLRDSHQEPGLNWAKYRIEESHGAVVRREKVSFYILWQNPRTVTVLADILVRLTVHGHCGCRASRSGFATWLFTLPDSQSRAEVSARLTIWGLWTEPAPQWQVDNRSLATVTATGGFWADTDQTSIGEAPAVSTAGFAVPGEASILIEASIAVDYELLAGSIDADFASANLFSVGCPYAIVTLPPEMNMQP